MVKVSVLNWLLSIFHWITNLCHFPLHAFTAAMKMNKMPDTELMLSLRNAPYKEAQEGEKEAWYFYVNKLLPCVVLRGWTRLLVRASCLLKDKATVTDEAFTLWIIFVNLEDWKQELERKSVSSAGVTNEEPHTKKLHSTKGKHKSKSELKLFLSIYNKIKEQRNNQFSNEWEEAFLQVLRSKNGMSNIVETHNIEISYNDNTRRTRNDVIPMDDFETTYI